jgi:serine/threonine protein kinase
MNSVQGLESISPINALPVGTQLNEYIVRSMIGEGGFGIVYLAHDTLLDREVAIKEYLPASFATRSNELQVGARSADRQELFERGLQRFVKEAHILARFRHPALVSVLRFFSANGTAYMVMPYYRGKTLRDMIRGGYRASDTKSLLSILLPVLAGLSQIHSVECYHLDVSADNILILENGTPVLLDFGSARHEQITDLQSATIILKPGFAPVEQYSDGSGLKIGPWTDVYALSAVAYQLVTGAMPVISVARIVQDTLKPLSSFATPELSAEVLGVIDSGLSVNPQDRPQTIVSFITTLRSVARRDSLPEGGVDAGDEDVTLALLSTPVTQMPDVESAAPGKKISSIAERGAAALHLFIQTARNRANAIVNTVLGAAKLLSGKVMQATPHRLNAVVNAVSGAQKWLGGKVVGAFRAAKKSLGGWIAAIALRWQSNKIFRIATVCTVLLLIYVAVFASINRNVLDRSDSVVPDTSVGKTHEEAITPPTVHEKPEDGGGQASMPEPDVIPVPPVVDKTPEAPTPPLLAEGGTVEVAVRPWGHVYLNGVRVGTAPPRLVLKNVPNGTHRIEIRNESGAVHARSISVSEGQTVSVTHTF